MSEEASLIILGLTILLSMLISLTRKIERCTTPCGSCEQVLASSRQADIESIRAQLDTLYRQPSDRRDMNTETPV